MRCSLLQGQRKTGNFRGIALPKCGDYTLLLFEFACPRNCKVHRSIFPICALGRADTCELFNDSLCWFLSTRRCWFCCQAQNNPEHGGRPKIGNYQSSLSKDLKSRLFPPLDISWLLLYCKNLPFWLLFVKTQELSPFPHATLLARQVNRKSVHLDYFSYNICKVGILVSFCLVLGGRDSLSSVLWITGYMG